MLLFCLGFLLGLTWCGCGIPTTLLSIHPEEPLVERGGSVQLTCSMDCPGGKVQWRGLDTDLGNIVSNHTYSILTVHNATVGAEGEKSCVGQCLRKPYQKKVELRVYSFPDSLRLESHPEKLTAGQLARLTCSVSHVYPPGSLTLSWFQGEEPLAASPAEEEEVGDAHDPLFAYRSVLEVPAAVAGTAYKCRATLGVGQWSFQREKVANVGIQDARVMADTTEKSTASGRISYVTTSNPLTPAWWIPLFTAASKSPLRSTGTVSKGTTSIPPTLDSAPKTGNLPVEMSSSPGFLPLGNSPVMEANRVLLTPKAEAASSGKPSMTHSFTAAPATLQVPASISPRVVSAQEEGCHAMIKSEPSAGSTGRPLRITCHVPDCSTWVRIQWVETPAPQSQYQQEEAEGRSTLSVDSAGMEHQGVYRCVPRSSWTQAVSLRVTVTEDEFHMDSVIAAGTVGCLFGLVVTGYVLHRTWRKRAI